MSQGRVPLSQPKVRKIARVEIDKAGKIVIIAKDLTEAQSGESATEVNEWDRV